MKNEKYNMTNSSKKILLTGGGTAGSVAPLLAVANQLSIINYKLLIKFLWIGTKYGPERKMVEEEKIEFKSIVSGKLRRYFSAQNVVDPFLIIAGFIQSLFIILKQRPALIMSAGSFVSVPVIWAGWLCRVPILIHQQDARPGLANKLMAPFADVITVTFEKSLADYGKKAVWTGNAGRELIINNEKLIMKSKLEFNKNLPVLLVMGGGTGAVAINEMIWERLDELTKLCQIIHLTGKNKLAPKNKFTGREIINYKSFEFMNREEIAEAYAVADMVVSRAGMGALTELSYLGKPAIIIPMPDSHQEENAKIFKEKNAAIVLDQKNITAKILIKNIKELLENKSLQNKLSKDIKEVIKPGANQKLAELALSLIQLF
jgi:UDP-N-acetylglucosamine--N-acetylmuramyl-(pentapeptide) pyrophosphoryl-undecaprenol N-acetylglucosamine transferase